MLRNVLPAATFRGPEVDTLCQVDLGEHLHFTDYCSRQLRLFEAKVGRRAPASPASTSRWVRMRLPACPPRASSAMASPTMSSMAAKPPCFDVAMGSGRVPKRWLAGTADSFGKVGLGLSAARHARPKLVRG